MPRHIAPPVSIRERGLENYLNETAALHKQKGYKEFEIRVRLKVPKPVIAEDFGVVVRTVYHWLAIYKEEATSRQKSAAE